jgi:hypothetical protein
MEDMLKHALYYLSQGFSVIPIDFDGRVKGLTMKKSPLLFSTDKYLETPPTIEEVTEWWGRWPWAAIGIPCGKVSGLTVIDSEKDADLTLFGLEGIETPTAKSGGGGKHYYFAYDPDIQNKVKFAPFYDIRCDRGYIIAPPSPHDSGSRYEWLEPLGSVPLAPFPQNVKEAIKTSCRGSKADLERLLGEGVIEGERNVSATKVAGSLLAKYPPDQWETVVWPILEMWNREKNKPPDDSEKLRKTYESICRAELAKRNLNESAQGMFQLVPSITSNERELKISFSFDDSTIDFLFKEIEYGRNRALDTDLTVSYRVPGLRAIEYGSRLNVNSGSSRRDVSSELEKSFGKKYSWPLMLAMAVPEIKAWLMAKGSSQVAVDITPMKSTMLFKPFLVDKSANLVFGDGGSAKSYFCIALAISLATDVPFLGLRPERRCSVLYLDWEDRGEKFSDRLFRVAGGMEESPRMEDMRKIHYRRAFGQPLGDLVPLLKHEIRDKGIGLLVIDSAAYACASEIEKAENVIRFFNALDELDTASLIIAHVSKGQAEAGEDGKGQRYAIGSIFFHNGPRNSWNVAKLSEDGVDNPLKRTCLFHRKCNDGPLHQMIPLETDFSQEGMVTIRRGTDTGWEQGKSVSDRILTCLKEAGGPLNRKEIYEELSDLKPNSLKSSLGRLVKDKEIILKGGHKGDYFLAKQKLS